MDRCTVHLRTDVATGTGFLFAFRPEDIAVDKIFPGIVTNLHVIADAKTLTLTLSYREKGTGRLLHAEATKPLAELAVVPHPDGLDLCAISLTAFTQPLTDAGHQLQITLLDRKIIPNQDTLQSLETLHDIVMVGYPNSLWDQANNKAIFRKGTTATHPALGYNNQRLFLADIAVFPGSSGSPIFLHEDGVIPTGDGGYSFGGSRTMLLGVVHAVYQHETVNGKLKIVQTPIGETFVPVVNMPNNLGLCIQAQAILEIEAVIQQRFFAAPKFPGGYNISFQVK
jgi:hypothetical protein